MTYQDLIVLAILCQTERYGYEISHIVEDRRISVWYDFALSSIYAVLGKLESKGLVTRREMQQSGRPPRKLYAISPSGRVELEASFTALLNPESRLLGAMEIVLLAWPILSGDTRKRLMGSYLKFIEARIERLERSLEDEINPLSAANHSRPLAIAKAEQEWLMKFLSDNGIEAD